MSLGSIIRKKRKELNLTLDELSDRIGFSKPYLSTIETGKVKNPPSDHLLRKLEGVLRLEKGYLLHIAHIEKLPTELRGHIESTQAENKKLRLVFKNLINSKDQTIEKILDSSQLDLPETTSIQTGKLIPIINKVSAGYPADFDDLDYPAGIADDYVRCPDIYDPNAFAVRVIGDSMEPKFIENDIIVFSPNTQVNNGDDCFVRFKNPYEATFKRIFFEDNHFLRLQPRNDSYRPQIIHSDRINGIYRAVRKIQVL